MGCLSDSSADFQASRLSCPPLCSTQRECNCGVKLMCLLCLILFAGAVQSAILLPRVTFPAIRLPSADRPSVAKDPQDICEQRTALCVALRRRENFQVRSLCVRLSTHTGQCAAGLWSVCCLSAPSQFE